MKKATLLKALIILFTVFFTLTQHNTYYGKVKAGEQDFADTYKKTSNGIFRLNEATPEFRSYIDKKSSNLLSDENIIIPSPYKLDPVEPSGIQDRIRGLFYEADDIPAKYDLRDEQRVTSVKDQGESGLCWAFSANGAYESNLIDENNFNFSEMHMGYALSNTGGNKEGFSRVPGTGGNSDMASAYYLRWSGPVLEDNDPFNNMDNLRHISITNKKPVYGHCQNIIQIPPPGDTSASKLANKNNIKKSIMKYGGICTAYHSDESYYNSANGNTSYYFNRYNENIYSNHAVVIVGWDDNYAVENFKSGKRPSSPGAYLVKNSWGDNWGDDGYFYISYEDRYIGEGAIAFNEIEGLDNYDNIYQHDPLGRTTVTGSGTSSGGYANVFSLNEYWNEELSAVGFYVNGAGADYEIWINENDENLSNCRLVKTGSVDMSGYYTVKLPQTVPLTGINFTVAVKLTLWSGTQPIALEMPFDYYSEDAKASWGQSYITTSGTGEGVMGNWDELTSWYENTNACIKAYTNKKDLHTVYLDRFDDVTAESCWAKEYIDGLSQAGIMEGTFENYRWYFKPQNNITRAEFAAVVSRVFNINKPDTYTTFNDIVSHWAYDDIVSAASAGIVQGINVLEFRPDDPITREDMCTIISRSLIMILEKPVIGDDDIEENLSMFDDESSISDYARLHIANNMMYNLINGYEENGQFYIKARNYTTRAEISKVIYKINNELMR